MKVRYEYQDYDGDTTAEDAPDGKQWAFVTLRAENTGDEAATAPGGYGMKLVADQSQYEDTIISKEEHQYDGGDIQPGIVREGWIAYEVDDDVEMSSVEVVWDGVVNGGSVTAIWSP